MSKVRPWLPNATPVDAGGIPIEVDPAVWPLIAGALGAPLGPSDQDQLAEIGGQYMALRRAELDRPLAEDAFAHVDDIEDAARALKVALQPLLQSDGAAYRVARLFDYALREVHRETGAPANLAALHFLEPAPDLLISAADRVRKKLTSNGPLGKEVETSLPTYSWDWLIDALANFCKSRGMEITARGDYEAYKKASPFVLFVFEFQKLYPAEYRRSNGSHGALSRAVYLSLQRRSGVTHTPG